MLTKEQQELFEEIEKLGSDAMARGLAEELINERLAGAQVTQALVLALKDSFVSKERSWGIRCIDCGEPATPIWDKRSMVQGHSIASGGYARHASRTILPKIKLVERNVRIGRPPLQ